MLKLHPLMDPSIYNEAFVENIKQLKDSVLNTTLKNSFINVPEQGFSSLSDVIFVSVI